MKILIVTALAVCGITVFAQQSAKPPAFETAAIKMSKTTDGSDSHSSPGYFRGSGTLKAFIGMAYGVTNEQIESGPKWLDQDRYDIEARAQGPVEGPQLLAMLQTLLADRFQLAFHRESRIVSGYALVPAKGGLKIQEVPLSDSHSTHGGRGVLTVKNISLDRFATTLARMLGAPVSNETGNSGAFDFTLKWAPENSGLSPSVSAGPAAEGPSLYTALDEQLGLQLVTRKVPLELIVVDRAEKPSLDGVDKVVFSN